MGRVDRLNVWKNSRVFVGKGHEGPVETDLLLILDFFHLSPKLSGKQDGWNSSL